MTTLELIREVDERLEAGSDDELVALAGELEGCMAAAADLPDEVRARLAWRLERLAFVMKALDL